MFKRKSILCVVQGGSIDGSIYTKRQWECTYIAL